jgi:hypothetical protein
MSLIDSKWLPADTNILFTHLSKMKNFFQENNILQRQFLEIESLLKSNKK